MYKIEDRSHITRYYNVEKRNAVEKSRGEEWKKYRQMWDATDFSYWTPDSPPPPHLLEINIELTSYCNYSCIMCGKSYTEQKIKESMPLDLVEKIAKEAKQLGVYSLWVGAGSECMLHPQIADALKILFSANTIDCTFLSNGSLITDEVARIFVEHQTGQLSISLDAASEEVYKIVRRGGTLPRVERNIQHFLDLRGDNLFPLLRVTMVKLKENENEREAFLKKWENRADVIDFQTCVDFQDINDIDNVVNWMKKPCFQAFKRLYVHYNGNVYPCCNGYGIHYPLGNIKDMSLAEIWNSKRLNDFRKLVLDGNTLPNFCRKCQEIKPLKRLSN